MIGVRINFIVNFIRLIVSFALNDGIVKGIKIREAKCNA